jgi:hypothetical protein
MHTHQSLNVEEKHAQGIVTRLIELEEVRDGVNGSGK